MGYADRKARKQHEADAERIRELEAQLKKAQGEKHGRTIEANDTVTVEKTSKRLKSQLAVAWMSIFLGVALAVGLGYYHFGSVLFVIGVFALVYTKIQIWWRHG